MFTNRIVSLLMAAFTALALVSLFLWSTGYSPTAVFRVLVSSTWASPSGLMQIAAKTALLILTGLAVALPYRAGLFNIGGEGQFLWGGLAAAAVGACSLGALGPLHLILCLLSGILCGAVWGWIAAALKNLRGAHEVISTIMLNFIAFQIINELTLGALNAGGGSSRTAFVSPSATMPVLMSQGAGDTSWGIALSAAIAAGFSWLLYQTWFGFSLRAVGSNPSACAYSGIAVNRIRSGAMLIGGGCAGLGGALQVTGVDHTFYARFAGSYGFDGIAVAFLALCEPWATIPAALVIATLRAADRSLQLDVALPREIVLMLEGILIVCIAIFARRRHENE